MNEILQINKDAKIIFISADSEIQQRALENGAKGFLTKPILEKQLMNEIKIQLGFV